MSTARVDTHILSNPQTDKETERKEGQWRGEGGGEPWESDKTVQWVHGDRRPLGTRKAEKRIQVLSNIHLTLPVCLFIFFFSVNHPFCKSTYLTYFLLFQCFSLLRKDGWESGKKSAGAIIQAKGVSRWELQGQMGKVRDIGLLEFTHQPFDFLCDPFALG